MDLSECVFTAESDRRVKVTGSRFVPETVPSVKLEGAKVAGYRTISICGNRDPIFISQIDDILENLKKRTADNLSADFDYSLDFIVYGKNGVMGALEPNREITSHEIGIVIDVVADSQEQLDQAQERLDRIMQQMKEAEGVTEAMKATDPMALVQRMNSIAVRAEEIVREELIFV